jgi:uncharacterized protein (TIGR01244 family)
MREKDGKITFAFVILVVSASHITPAFAQRERLDQIQQSLKDDVPKILCVDKNFATAGQPKDEAFGKLAAQGFRSVLNLRTAAEGLDLERERQLVEKAGMRYISIPVTGSAPKPEQADEFVRVVGDGANHPMLIHCGSANRVGGFMLIYRVLGQGWPQDKALEEATQIGLTSPAIKRFALDYIATHKQRSK